ncbi:DUF2937 family protein [Litorilituus sediminis]|uniref:DUF2937 family protein n=2 Tax=Litorilituus sediminis TaxID=718192 RepID=A0A4P6P6V3_9GAMM|nr:DUF2937 family protein [Litorilituus sediminis]QBG37361.1 DUF2937 family protein [Litorilituus sediminis]
MFMRLIDKLIFGLSLIIALQVPQLADHYQQFIFGLYQATHAQVLGYQQTARLHEYEDVNAMIAHHLQNDVKSVRTDAQQKLDTLALHQSLIELNQVFETGNLIEKAYTMLQPAHFSYLEKTLTHFTLGVPLSANAIGFSVVFALLLNLVITSPVLLFTYVRKRRQRAHALMPSKEKHD